MREVQPPLSVEKIREHFLTAFQAYIDDLITQDEFHEKANLCLRELSYRGYSRMTGNLLLANWLANKYNPKFRITIEKGGPKDADA